MPLPDPGNKTASEQPVEVLIRALQKRTETLGIQLDFELDGEKAQYLRVIDRENGDLVRLLPIDEVLKSIDEAGTIDRLSSGLLISGLV